MRANQRHIRFAICLTAKPGDDLEVGKVYRQIKGHKNDMENWIRVIDESGEDYLFPARRFVPVDLPAKAKRVIASASAG